MNFIGVDVDSSFLVCQICRNGKSECSAQFDNTPLGHRKFIKWATKRGTSARVCMEATGVYSLPFALSLHAEQHIEVAVVNPRAIKKYADSIMQRGKTDLMDAAVILDYAQRMPFRTWQPPSKETLEIQHICRRIVQLNVELNRESNRHKAAKRLGFHGHNRAVWRIRLCKNTNGLPFSGLIAFRIWNGQQMSFVVSLDVRHIDTDQLRTSQCTGEPVQQQCSIT